VVKDDPITKVLSTHDDDHCDDQCDDQWDDQRSSVTECQCGDWYYWSLSVSWLGWTGLWLAGCHPGEIWLGWGWSEPHSWLWAGGERRELRAGQSGQSRAWVGKFKCRQVRAGTGWLRSVSQSLSLTDSQASRSHTQAGLELRLSALSARVESCVSCVSTLQWDISQHPGRRLHTKQTWEKSCLLENIISPYLSFTRSILGYY